MDARAIKSYRITALGIACALLALSANAQTININGDRIQFPDGSEQSTAAPAPSPRNLTVPAATGTPVVNGQALLDAVNGITGASKGFPFTITLEAGSYDLQTNGLILPEFVNLRGAGMEATTVRGNPTSGVTPVVQTNGNAVISDLKIRHKGGSGLSGRAVTASGENMRFENVLFQVLNSFDSGATLTALSTAGGCKVVAIDCAIEITATSLNAIVTGVAMGLSPSTFTADGLSVSVRPSLTPSNSFGIFISGSGDVDLNNCTFFNTPGTSLSATVFASDSSFVRIRNSVIETTPGNIAIDGSTGDSATPVRVLSSQIIGTRSGSNVIYRNSVDDNFNAIP